MANDENLIPAKKGEVRNPHGRPKGSKNRSTIVREILEHAALSKYKKAQKEAIGEDLGAQSIAEQMTSALVIKAMSGDVAAFKELMDSGYGKLLDKVENTHKFQAMGRVTHQIEGKDEVEALEFDVGKAAPVQEDENE